MLRNDGNDSNLYQNDAPRKSGCGGGSLSVSLRGLAQHAYLWPADSLDHRTITSTRGKHTYSQSGDEITLDMTSVGADGKQIGSHMVQFTLKKGDKVVGRTTRTVSKDGKKLTSSLHETPGFLR